MLVGEDWTDLACHQFQLECYFGQSDTPSTLRSSRALTTKRRGRAAPSPILHRPQSGRRGRAHYEHGANVRASPRPGREIFLQPPHGNFLSTQNSPSSDGPCQELAPVPAGRSPPHTLQELNRRLRHKDSLRWKPVSGGSS